MKSFLLLLCLLVGCAHPLQVEQQLLQTSRNGIGMIRKSLENQQKLIENWMQKDRQELSDAFEQDLKNQPMPDESWVLEAHQAYRIALETKIRRDESIRHGFRIDMDNLDAVEQALVQIEQLNDRQLQWMKGFSR